MINLLLSEDLPSNLKILVFDSKLVPWGKGEKELLRVKRT